MWNNYKVEISELRCRHEYIRASSPEEAEKIAKDRYYNNEIEFSSDDRVDDSVQIIVSGMRGNFF